MTGTGIVGRDGELQTIAAALEAAHDRRPTVVWVEGEAGSGKSTLVQHAVALFRQSASDVGHRVVWWVSGDPEEQVIEHGITDALLAQAGAQVPAPREPGQEHHARSALLLQRVTRASDHGVVLLVLDDAHWCDHSSRQAFRFLLRRLDGLRVLVLVAHRPMGEWPADTRRAAGAVRSELISLGGLGVAGVRQFMALRGVPLTPRAGRRLHDHTEGNPQLLQALAEELSPDELAAGVGPLPAPRSFTDWVHEAYLGAAPEVRAVVAAASVLGGPASVSQVSTMTSLEQPQVAMDDAIAHRLLHLVVHGEDRRVDVSHALVRSAVNEAMGFAEFSQLHERAAGLTTDPLRAMVHRLQACGRPDTDLVGKAVALAEQQAAAGATLASARLLTMAGELLPAGTRRHELWISAANHLLGIGEVRWAEKLLADVASQRHQEPSSEEHLVASHLALQLHRPNEARQRAMQAWEQGSDPRAVTGAAELLAYLGMDSGDGEAAAMWSARAVEAVDTRLAHLQWASTVLASSWALRGDLRPAAEFLHAHRARLAGTRSEPDILLGLVLTELWRGRLAQAEEGLVALRRLTEGSAVLRATTRLAGAELDFRLGRWDAVLAATESELTLVDEGWESRTAPMTLAVGAYASAARGQVQRAREFIARAESLLEPLGNLPARTMVAVAVGRLAQATESHADVVAALAPLQTDVRTAAIPEGVHAWRADLAEALVALGRPLEAAPLLTVPESLAENPLAMVGILRAQGVLAAAQGSPVEAEALLERAIAVGTDSGDTFGRARAESALGALLRRRGHRRMAGQHLTSALTAFDALGAVPLGDAARRELELCALRRGTGDGGLTPAEGAVARLAVAGCTNREIAQRLTVSIKTVETHMGRVFTKLGVRHRVELVTVLADADADSASR